MDNKSSASKFLVIGVDGATFSVIKPWVKKGLLPNFGNLLKNGVHCDLQSTIPPITGPAWASFQTGKNPGQHGVFDWLKREKNGYNLKPIDSSSIKHETLWEIIGNQGKKVGVINVPLTYPLKKINGFLISGMLTPSKNAEFVFPPSIMFELNKNFNDYEILPKQRFEPHKIQKWITGLKNMIKKRKQLALHLLNNYEWDFSMIYFVATDVVQHRMWHTINKNRKNFVLEIYQEVDEAIGEIIASLPGDVSILIMSDHGFGPLYYNIYLNNWLKKEKYLKLKKGFISSLKKILYKMNITPATIYNLLGKLRILSKGLSLGPGQRYNLVSKFFLSSNNINWKLTKVYSYGNIGQLYINTVGREPQGYVPEEDKEALISELISKLRNVTNPNTGKNLYEKIFRKEDIYSGIQLNNAPDIVILPNNLESTAVGATWFISNSIIEPSFAFTGGHRMEGILIACGKNIKKSTKIKNARIIDLAPTILYGMGLAVPDDMDGKILDDIFDDTYLKNNKVRYTKGKTISDKPTPLSEYSKKEENRIKKNLEDLGYIS